MDEEGPLLPDEAVGCLWRLAGSAGDLYRLIGRLGEAVAADGCADVAGLRPLPLDARAQLIARVCEAVRTVAREGERFRRGQVTALCAEGLAPEQVAAVFGVSRQRVAGWLAALPAGQPGGEPASGASRQGAAS